MFSETQSKRHYWHKILSIYVPPVIGWSFLILGVFGLVFCFGAGYLLDDLALSPFFGFKGESTATFRKEINLDLNENQCFTRAVYHITNPETGNVGAGVNLAVYRNDELLISVGGKCPTFVGFKDVNNDGYKDLLVKSHSIWAEQGVWLQKDSRFHKSSPNQTAKFILAGAEVLLYSGILLTAAILLNLIGLLCIFENRVVKKKKGTRSRH